MKNIKISEWYQGIFCTHAFTVCKTNDETMLALRERG